MKNTLALPPPADIYNEKKTGYYSNLIGGMVPYSQSNISEVLADLNVKIPFTEVIDRSMGISTCPLCNARYAGYQDRCTKVGYFYYSNAYSSRSKRYLTRQDFNKDNSGYYADKACEGWVECETSLEWDKRVEFNNQAVFFSDMVDLHNLLTNYDPGSFSVSGKYENALPPGMAVALERKAMIFTIKNLENQLLSHQNVLKEICERMQSAGQTLSFGNF